jgi:hypothetical protein
LKTVRVWRPHASGKHGASWHREVTLFALLSHVELFRHCHSRQHADANRLVAAAADDNDSFALTRRRRHGQRKRRQRKRQGQSRQSQHVSDDDS